jgi:S-DNA-T family DNA segregation ATPase FtsK/SpoIIIE
VATTRTRPARKSARPPARKQKRPKAGGARAKSTASTRKATGPRPGSRLISGLRRADVWGAVLVVVGVLAALGTYAGLTGPWGRELDRAAAAAIGIARYAVPPALVWMGARLARGRTGDGTGRVAGGIALLLVAGDGLASLVAGGAGGALGRGVSGPLRDALSPWGAGVILASVAGAGVLVATATPVGTAASHLGQALRWLADAARPGIDKVRAGIRWLGSLSSETSGEPTADATLPPAEAPAPFDVTGADEPDDATGPLTVPAAAAPPEAEDAEDVDLAPAPAGDHGPWTLPPLSLLARSAAHEVDERLVEQAGRTLERALAAHGVETRLAGMTVGPTVTRYELELGPGVKVARVTSLNRDIAYAMASPDVRILAPIPGRSAIGVEVPNQQRQLVAVGDILASGEAARATHPCEVALGRDISGRAVMANLAEMPHILIAGATGAGKSSCLNSLITSLLVRTTPDQVRLILVDPKRVELGQYNGLPHLLTPVVVSPKKAANALSWAVKEMERRYDLLSEVGVRDVTGYNAAYDRGDLRTEPRAEGVDDPAERLHTRLPYIVVVVDELNDLMMVAARDVEESICRIAQMARAVGIHLVIATQRPSVNVITGVIKANVPARLAFAVSSLADSRVILDQAGAERLVGQGDMLLLGAASSTPRRIQGAWVGEDEVAKVVAHWRRQSPSVSYTAGVEGDDDLLGSGTDSGGSGDDDDDLCRAAMELVVRSQLGSTSMLQRKLRVGFARAGRLMDLLEQRGVVGPSTGSKARDVLMTTEELDQLLAGSEAP